MDIGTIKQSAKEAIDASEARTNPPMDEREKIVLRAMNLRQDDINDLEAFDALVCHALGIDDDEPPMFIADSLLSTP